MKDKFKIMNTYKKSILLLGFLLLHISLLMAQQVIPIYEGKPLYSIAPDSAKEISKKSDIIYVSKVVKPTITCFFPKKPNGTAILICPGGGYSFLAWDHEGTFIAQLLNQHGITAFVVKYRLPDDLLMEHKSIVPLTDALEAMKMVRAKASEWKLDSTKIGIMGFSAGGHLAASVANHYDDFENGRYLNSGKPDFSILVYPVIFSDQKGHQGSSTSLLGKQPADTDLTYFDNAAQVGENTPPAILFHSSNDGAVTVDNSIAYYTALRKQKKAAELHIYQDGGHGFGLLKKAPGNSYKNWTNDLLNWLKSNSLTN